MNVIEKLMVDKLKPMLLPAGFKWKASEAKFFREEFFGFSSLCLILNSTQAYGGGYELDTLLQVRHNVVEDIVNQLGFIYGEEGKRYTTTVSRSLDFFPLTDGESYVHIFPFRNSESYPEYAKSPATQRDIDRAAAAIVALVTKGEGAAFFRRYAVLDNCTRDLNHPIQSGSHPLCNDISMRAYYGITTAWLTQRERVPELIVQYLDFIKIDSPGVHEIAVAKVNQLMAILHSGTP